MALNIAGENTPVGWWGPRLLTPNSLHPTVSHDPRNKQLCLKASPWMMSLISQISLPGKGQKGRRKGREVREVLGRIREGQIKSFCMPGESHSSPNKWRAFPPFMRDHFTFIIKLHFRFKSSQSQLPANLQYSPYDLFWRICLCNMLCASFGTMEIHKWHG